MMNLLVGSVALLSVVVQSHQRTEHAKRAFYEKLFTLSQPGIHRVHLPERGPCNMPMIRGNAQVDPKMVKPIEKGNTDPRIRAIVPTICWLGGARSEEVIRKR